MAELHLSDGQQQQLARLVAALGEDAALRQRFEGDVREVFTAYGLSDLLPSEGDFQARLADSEVSGFALGGGSGSGGGTHLDGHIDWPHSDVAAIGGFRLIGVPTFRQYG
jgi:hypothetical protein